MNWKQRKRKEDLNELQGKRVRKEDLNELKRKEKERNI